MTLGDDNAFALLVAGDTDPMIADIRGFRNSVMRWLGGLAVLLTLGTALLMRWGLTAVAARARRTCDKIRDGDIPHLEGEYPSEIEPLVHDLNALIDSNREIVDRARTHVGNLAHALKTPLAVLQNETRGGARARSPPRWASRSPSCASQVEHHLNRARIAAQANVIGAVTPDRAGDRRR